MSPEESKQFRIRDLHDVSSSRGGSRGSASLTEPSRHSTVHDTPSQNSTDLNSRHGLVRISGSDYDKIASNYPGAMLRYVDNDEDGEMITVGSSLELLQRLSDPIDIQSQLEQENYECPMHIFDIRRSKSVINLWKSYECQQPIASNSSATCDEAKEASHSGDSDSVHVQPPDGSQSFLEAFEAEMVKIMERPEPAEGSVQSDESPSVEANSQPASFDRAPNPADIFAHTVQFFMDGAGLICSELGSKLPELDQRLHDAQRTVPEHVATSLRTALASIDSQTKNVSGAFHNASATLGQRKDQSSQVDAPVSDQPVETFRTMVSEIGQIGQSLFESFGSEIKRDTETGTGHTGNEDAPNVPGNERQEQSNTDDKFSPSFSVPQSLPRNAFENGKGAVASAPQAADASTIEPSNSTSAAYHRSSVEPQQPIPSSRNDKTQHFGLAGHSHSHLHPQPPSVSHEHPINQNYIPLRRPTSFKPHHFRSSPVPVPSPYRKPRRSLLAESPLRDAHPPPPPHPDTGRDWQPRSQSDSRYGSCALPYRTHKPKGEEALRERATQLSQGATDVPSKQSANSKLFVGNVGFNVTEKMIRDVFASKGFLVDVELPFEAGTKKHAGFGYLHFASVHAAKAALDALQGAHIDGHSINLEFSERPPMTGVRATQTTDPARPVVPNRQTTSAQPGIAVTSDGNTGPVHAGNTISSAVDKTESQRKSPTILDEGGEDPEFSARYPSLVPEVDQIKSTKGAASEQLRRLSPELEMKRFPPVSQVEAYLLANRRGGSQTASSNMAIPEFQAATRNDGNEARKSDEKDNQPITPGAPPQFSFLRGFQDASKGLDERRSSLFGASQVSERGLQREERRKEAQLRRSNTTLATRLSNPFDTFTPNGSRSSVISPTGKREAERHTGVHDNRLGIGSRGAWDHDANNSAIRRSVSLVNDRPSRPREPPVEDIQSTDLTDTDHADPRRRAAINNCVATLLSLGYGSRKDGGRQRVAVYAAAADGKVLDAIDMIEEERKVYERREQGN